MPDNARNDWWLNAKSAMWIFSDFEPDVGDKTLQVTATACGVAWKRVFAQA